MAKKHCIVCQKDLVGRQRQFCSKACGNQHWVGRFREGSKAPKISADPETQAEYEAFHRGFMKLLEDHAPLFKKLKELV